MPRKPKAKDGLTARERAALYEAEQAQKQARLSDKGDNADVNEALSERAGDPLPRSSQGAEIKAEKKVETILPKPQHATVRVDLSLELDEIIRLALKKLMR